MAKLTHTDLTQLSSNETSAVSAINANGALTETAMENTLSRDGSAPNTMSADIDLNSNKVINVAAPTANGDAVTKLYGDTNYGGASVTLAAASAAAALVSENAADASATAAATSETNAATSETNAATSETNAATSAVAAAAAVPVFNAGTYGAVADGTDATASIQAAIDAAVAAGGGTVLIPVGDYSISSLDLTNTQNIYLKGGSSDFGVRLYVDRQVTSGKPAIDMTGALRCGVERISVLGQAYQSAADPSIVPTEGFLVAESSTQSSVELQFTNVRTAGRFSKAAWLMFGCTNSNWFGCILTNDHVSGYAAYIGKTNATLTPTSAFDTVKTSPTAATENNFFGCEFHDRTTDNTATVETIYFDSARTANFHGCLISNGTAVGAYCGVNGTVEDLSFHGCKFYSETGTGTGDVFLLEASAVLTRLVVMGCVNDNTLQAGAQFIKDGGSSACTGTIVCGWKAGETVSDIAAAFAMIVDTGGIKTELAFAIDDNLLTLRDAADATKNFKIDVAAVTTGTTRTWSIVDTNDTFVGTTASQTLSQKTLTAPVINGAITGDTIATQAEQETGSAVDNIVSSGRQHYHPSASKGWIKGDMAGGVEASYNVTSISDVGVGRPIVNWATDFSSTEYSVIAITKTGSAYYTHIADGNFNAGQTEINIRNTSGTLVDGTSFMAQAFGDQ